MTDDFKVRFLIVDDEQSIRRLCMTIGAVGRVSKSAEAESAEAALACLETDSPDIVLVDRMLPAMSGDEFLKQAKQMLPRTEFAMITGHGSIESAVEAMRSRRLRLHHQTLRRRSTQASASAHEGKGPPRRRE